MTDKQSGIPEVTEEEMEARLASANEVVKRLVCVDVPAADQRNLVSVMEFGAQQYGRGAESERKRWEEWAKAAEAHFGHSLDLPAAPG